jgi:hypothetical protein
MKMLGIPAFDYFFQMFVIIALGLMLPIAAINLFRDR